ncbi:hypothetical protein AB4Z09_28800, partial [Rhodococcus sp. TAF43]|uniref:hypothetical protein n=1 Tax=Rhodococcus sp. TAF43 TaxID=3237483 RepID=UPI003F9CADCB
MSTGTGTIDWSKLSREQFERIVEVLLRRKWEGAGATVICPDGRGGDGGIDVEVQHSDGHRSIYQIKHFPDGFSGNLKSTRQRQIAGSFVTAMKLLPPPSEWFLVVPAKLTKGERQFVLALEAHRTLSKEGIAPPTVNIVGITELDDLVVDDPGVYRYLARNLLRGDVEAYGLERATLTGEAGQLHQRLADLGDLTDSTDLHWGYDFARRGDCTTVTVRPQHPSAAALSPITTSLNLGFRPEHESIRRQFERSMRFGASGDVLLPRDVVKQVTIDGPELIRGTHTKTEIILKALGRPAAVGTPLTIQFHDTEGTLHAVHKGTVTYADSGTDGFALRAEFYGHLTCEFLTPSDSTQKGNSDISYT